MSLIEQLKHNKTAFGLLEPEEQKCFKDVGEKNCERIGYCGKWYQALSFQAKYTYRIQADYQPEPQTERCLVEPAVGGLRYRKTDWRGGHKYLHEALSDPDFMYFEFEDDAHSSIPRIHNADKPADIPKWVLFAKRSK